MKLLSREAFVALAILPAAAFRDGFFEHRQII
jgi:hypothetical protein